MSETLRGLNSLIFWIRLKAKYGHHCLTKQKAKKCESTLQISEGDINRLLFHKSGRNIIAGNGMALKKKGN